MSDPIDPHHEWRLSVDRRLDEGATKMKSISADLALNTEATQAVKNDTSELVSLLQSFKGAFVVFDMLGRLARPLGYIVMLGTALWGMFSMFKGGGEPPK